MEQLFDELKHYPSVMKMLANCPFNIIQNIMVKSYYYPGEFHLKQGIRYHDVYIILEGEFSISLIDTHSNRSILLTIYNQPGTFVGEQEALLNEPYSATVVNTTPCKLLQLSEEAFNRWVRLDKDFCFSLLKNQCQQVYELSGQAGYYTLHNAKEQISLFLVKQSRNGSVITKQDVHRSVAISNRHVNRILLDLSKKGVIDIHNTTIKVLDLEKLIYYGEEYND